VIEDQPSGEAYHQRSAGGSRLSDSEWPGSDSGSG
jgi:hypothetical protein